MSAYSRGFCAACGPGMPLLLKGHLHPAPAFSAGLRLFQPVGEVFMLVTYRKRQELRRSGTDETSESNQACTARCCISKGMKCQGCLSTGSPGAVVRYLPYRWPLQARGTHAVVIQREYRLSQSRFECRECGHAADIEINGAGNILAAGHATSEGGEMMKSGCPLKQEPTGASQALV